MGRGVAVALEAAFGVAVALACFAETALLEFSFSSVFAPALPSTLSPFAFWKARTARSVAGP